MSKSLKSSLLLLLTALIWGSAFVAQSVGMDYIGPYTFLGLRSILGAVALIPVLILTRTKINNLKKHIFVGVICGVVLCISSLLQQFGIMYTTVGKAGFITTLYIVIVPVMGLFLRKKPKPIIWPCMVLALVGLYLLCMTESISMEWGDFLVLLCSFGYAVHIMVVDHFIEDCDGLALSVIQYVVCGVICMIPMLVMEKPEMGEIFNAWETIAYAGILSTGVGYTLQIVAQKNINASVASLIMSMESVFAVLSGWVVLGQELTGREIMGCVLMFVAIVVSQIDFKNQ